MFNVIIINFSDKRDFVNRVNSVYKLIRYIIIVENQFLKFLQVTDSI